MATDFPFVQDDCGHRPLTYADPSIQRVGGRLCRTAYLYCDRCVPAEVRAEAEKKRAAAADPTPPPETTT